MRFHLNELAEILLFCAALTILIGMDEKTMINSNAWIWSSVCFLVSRLVSRQRGVETWQNLSIQSLAFGIFAYALTH